MLLQTMHICCVESPEMFYRFDNALFSSCVGVLLPLLVADVYHAISSDDRSIVHFLPETLQTLQRMLPVLLRRIPRILKLVSLQHDSDHSDSLLDDDDHFETSSPIHSRRLRARWSALRSSSLRNRPKPKPKKTAAPTQFVLVRVCPYLTQSACVHLT